MNCLDRAVYRGKRVDNGEWAYGFLVTSVSEETILIVSIDESEKRPFRTSNSIVDVGTLGQFTGLTDKNGVRIFEGMQVEHERGGFGGVVMWDDELTGYMVRHNPDGEGDSCFDIDFYSVEASK